MCGRENLIWEYADDLDPDEMVYRIKDVKQDLVVADTLLVHY